MKCHLEHERPGHRRPNCQSRGLPYPLPTGCTGFAKTEKRLDGRSPNSCRKINSLLELRIFNSFFAMHRSSSLWSSMQSCDRDIMSAFGSLVGRSQAARDIHGGANSGKSPFPVGSALAHGVWQDGRIIPEGPIDRRLAGLVGLARAPALHPGRGGGPTGLEAADQGRYHRPPVAAEWFFGSEFSASRDIDGSDVGRVPAGGRSQAGSPVGRDGRPGWARRAVVARPAPRPTGRSSTVRKATADRPRVGLPRSRAGAAALVRPARRPGPPTAGRVTSVGSRPAAAGGPVGAGWKMENSLRARSVS
jgi:hypothetical protein